MRNKILGILFAIACISGFAGAALAQMESGNYSIVGSVFSAGGAPAASANYGINATLGQPTPLMGGYYGTESATYQHYPGFWFALSTSSSTTTTTVQPTTTSSSTTTSIIPTTSSSSTTTSIQPTTSSSSTTTSIKPTTSTTSSTTTSIINDVQLSAAATCQPKDVFNTSPSNLESIYVSATLPIPAGDYTFYLVQNRTSWNNGDTICSPSCVTSKSIAVDSHGHFCDLLWTPPVDDNNFYDIILDTNGNGIFDLRTDFIDSLTAVGATTTLIELTSFAALPKSSEVILAWSTESEIDNAGFNLYRAEAENSNYIRINASLIPAKGSSTQGASYEFIDSDVQNRVTYYYRLEDIDLSGKSTIHGPVSATPRLIYAIVK